MAKKWNVRISRWSICLFSGAMIMFGLMSYGLEGFALWGIWLGLAVVISVLLAWHEANLESLGGKG